MIKLTPEEFMDLKKTDTVVILGSGYSINSISLKEWNIISSFDSMGFNWFCHHNFGPTFYIIREQATTRNRNIGTETRQCFYKNISKPAYRNTCIIVHNLKKHSPKSYSYKRYADKIKQKGIVVKDIKGSLSGKRLKQNIFTKGVFHGRCSLTNVVHIAIFMQYKRIIFAGVDLKNSRYFWLPKHKTRKNILQKRKTQRDRHPVWRHVIRLVKTVKNNFDIELICVSSKSLLNKIIDYKPLYNI